MHKGSMLRMEWFANNYVESGKGKRLLDVGSYNVNGCYRDIFNSMDIEYVGADIESGPNVDIVLDDIYNWNSIEDNSFDYIISGQAFEHIEYPWLTIKEIYKKIKPNGYICIIAPSSGHEHKFPKDCYRYYSDGMTALARWGGFEVVDVSVGGIPDKNASCDWDTDFNDVCLIAYKPSKGGGGDTKINRIGFPLERRFVSVNHLAMHYEFLVKWMEIRNKDKIIREYLQIHNCNKICVFGYEHIGINLVKVLETMDIEYEVVETGKVLELGSGELIIPWVELTEDKIQHIDIDTNTMIIVTIFDHNRDYIHYIDTIYPNCHKCYLYDLFDYMFYETIRKSNTQVYLYGAGQYGKLIHERMKEFGIEAEGFIVSDGKKDKDYFCDKPIFELHEIDKDAGIIISVKKAFEDEIRNILKGKGYKHIYDGKSGIEMLKLCRQDRGIYIMGGDIL